MATACSYWALSDPSAVRTVQPSGSTRQRWEPRLKMGSMVMVMPTSMRKPVPGRVSA